MAQERREGGRERGRDREERDDHYGDNNLLAVALEEEFTLEYLFVDRV